MGITVIASTKIAAASGNAANLANAAPPAEGGGIDFSALLGQQLSLSPAFDLSLQVKASAQGDSKGATEDASAADPASLLAAAGLLPALPAVPNPNIQSQAKTSSDEALRAAIGKAADTSGTTAQPATGTGDALLANKSATDTAGKTDALTAALADSRASNTANIAADDKSGANASANFAATLAAQAAAHQAQPQTETAAAAPQVSVPLQDSRWAQDFSDKVVWLAKNDQQTAQLAINPPQLGPVHITLNLSGDQATAVFASPHAEVRQAIQDALPELRATLSGAGIDLGQANVGAQLPQQQQQQNSGTPQQFSDSRRFGDEGAILHGDSGSGITTMSQPVRGGRGMVDLFA